MNTPNAHEPLESNVLKRLEETVERMTGEKAETLRGKTLSEIRTEAQKKTGRKFRFDSAFPVIGRGNVLRDRIIDGDTINREIDAILK